MGPAISADLPRTPTSSADPLQTLPISPDPSRITATLFSYSSIVDPLRVVSTTLHLLRIPTPSNPLRTRATLPDPSTMLQVPATTPRAHLPLEDLPQASTTSTALLRHPLTFSDSLRIGTSTTHWPRVPTALFDPSRVSANAAIIAIQRSPTTLATTNPLLTLVSPPDLNPLNGSQGATTPVATVLPVLHPTSLPPAPSATAHEFCKQYIVLTHALSIGTYHLQT